jgi:hypothetical protein
VALLDALARAFGEPAGSLVPSYAAALEGSGRNSGEAAMGTALPAPLPGQDSPPGVKNPYQRAAAARDAGASHGPNPMATGDRQTGEPTLAAVAGSAFPAAQPRVATATGLAGVAGTLAHYTGRLFKSTAGPRSDLPVRGERPSPAVISHRRGDRPAAATERTPSGSVPLASKRQQLAPLPAERVSSRPARALSSPDPWEASGAKASHHRETPVETWDESRRLADLINDVLVEQARLDGVDLS